jgi:hypothetical protein
MIWKEYTTRKKAEAGRATLITQQSHDSHGGRRPSPTEASGQAVTDVDEEDGVRAEQVAARSGPMIRGLLGLSGSPGDEYGLLRAISNYAHASVEILGPLLVAQIRFQFFL